VPSTTPGSISSSVALNRDEKEEEEEDPHVRDWTDDDDGDDDGRVGRDDDGGGQTEAATLLPGGESTSLKRDAAGANAKTEFLLIAEKHRTVVAVMTDAAWLRRRMTSS
jgi:hypothetical protein